MALTISVDDERERHPQDSAILELLAKGEREIAAGVGYSLDEALENAANLCDVQRAMCDVQSTR